MRYLKNGFFFLFLSCFVSLSHAKLTVNGVSYYSLKELASKLKLNLSWNPQREEGLLTGPNTQLSFLNKKRYVFINDVQVWLGLPLLMNGNELYVSEDDFSKAIAPIIVPYNYSMPPKLFHIVIDPGHGGNDQGTSSKQFNIHEKDLVLDVSHRLMKELQQNGYKVTLTRTKDQYVALKDRPDFANNVKADLFVSIHFNSVENGKNTVQGIETYILTLENHPSTSSHLSSSLDNVNWPGNKNDPWNALLGYCIQSNLTNNLQTVDRGLRRSRFAVLKTLNCPGVLVESGFLSHPEESQKINSPTYRQKIAQSIAAGIFAYQNTLNHISEKSNELKIISHTKSHFYPVTRKD